MVSVTLQNEAILFKWTTFSCLLLDWQSYCALGPELSFYQNYKSSLVICSVRTLYAENKKINFSLVSLKIHKYSFLQIQILCRWQHDFNFSRFTSISCKDINKENTEHWITLWASSLVFDAVLINFIYKQSYNHLALMKKVFATFY